MEVVSPSSMVLSWLPPDIQFWNGIITEYTVVYERLGAVEEFDDSSAMEPFTSQSISIPQPGLSLVNNHDPQFVTLPLQEESVLIEYLEEYYVYSFVVYLENTEGLSAASQTIIQEMPQAGIHIVGTIMALYINSYNPDISTHVAPSGSPTNVTIEVLSSTSVFIKWQPPELLLSNGVITKYTLSVHFVKNETTRTFSVPAATLSVHVEGILDNQQK